MTLLQQERYLYKWNETADRWQFSNDGSTENNMLLFPDFSGGDGITYTSGTGAIAVDSTVVRTSGAQVLQVKKHT